MSFWNAVVIIVAIIAFAVIRITRYGAGFGDHRDHKLQERLGRNPNSPSPREEQLSRELEDLRDRIAVLERIATEDRHGRAIAAEIESLRGK